MQTNLSVKKRSIIVAGHKTSVSVEDPFWDALGAIAGERKLNMSEIVTSIDEKKISSNLSSSIRLFVLDHYVSAAASKSSV
jgi:predicted DNA-binding ribbon-helix-helix protein